MARKTKLTPAIQERICDVLRQANYVIAACRAVGVSYQTFNVWMQKGRTAQRGIYREFREAVTRAIADAEVKLVEAWRAAVPEDWRAARDLLGRRFAERWGANVHEIRELTARVAELEKTNAGSPPSNRPA